MLEAWCRRYRDRQLCGCIGHVSAWAEFSQVLREGRWSQEHALHGLQAEDQDNGTSHLWQSEWLLQVVGYTVPPGSRAQCADGE